MTALDAIAFLLLVAMLGHILNPPKRGGHRPPTPKALAASSSA